MRYLVVCQHITGEIAALARYLAADRGNIVGLASEDHDQAIPGARRIILKRIPGGGGKGLQEVWAAFVKRAANARKSYEAVRDGGFYPEIMLVQTANGSGLYLKEVFPEAFMVAYPSCEPGCNGPVFEVMASMQALQMLKADLCLASFPCQLDALPPGLAGRVGFTPPFVDAEYFCPGGERSNLAGIICGRSSEAELRDIWKLAVAMALRDTSLKICLHACGTGEMRHFVAWKNNLENAVASRIYARAAFPQPELLKFARMCQLVYCPRPASANPEDLLALMSCGCLLLAPPGPEFFRPRQNMLPLEGDLPHVFQSIMNTLAKSGDFEAIRKNARQTMLGEFDSGRLVPAQVRYINNEYAAWLKDRVFPGETGQRACFNE